MRADLRCKHGVETRKQARPILRSGMGRQRQHARLTQRLGETGIVQGLSREGNCLENGAAGQVFGQLEDEFLRGRAWPDFESFRAGLDACAAHRNAGRRQVKLKGLAPGGSRSQSLAAQSLFSPFKLWGRSSFSRG